MDLLQHPPAAASHRTQPWHRQPDALVRFQRGLPRLGQVYGSSETAGIAWRDAPDAPYALIAHWTRPDTRAHERLRLSGHATPRAFALGAGLTRNAQGKRGGWL